MSRTPNERHSVVAIWSGVLRDGRTDPVPMFEIICLAMPARSASSCCESAASRRNSRMTCPGVS